MSNILHGSPRHSIRDLMKVVFDLAWRVDTGRGWIKAEPQHDGEGTLIGMGIVIALEDAPQAYVDMIADTTKPEGKG